MFDGKFYRGSPNRIRINIHADYELRYWKEKFGVSADRLRAAMDRIGPVANDVGTELKRNRG